MSKFWPKGRGNGRFKLVTGVAPMIPLGFCLKIIIIGNREIILAYYKDHEHAIAEEQVTKKSVKVKKRECYTNLCRDILN